jgi:hypothetical protein
LRIGEGRPIFPHFRVYISQVAGDHDSQEDTRKVVNRSNLLLTKLYSHVISQSAQIEPKIRIEVGGVFLGSIFDPAPGDASMWSRRHILWGLPLLWIFVLLAACTDTQKTRRFPNDDWPDITPTMLDYVDADAFDVLFETVLVNQDPVCVVRTRRTEPNWEPRLNAWIAAWNRSDKRKPTRRAASPETEEAPVSVTIRGQAALASALGKIDGETLREFRLLINDLLTRIETSASTGVSWWTEERIRSRRVALLKPYNLRFHLDEERHIELMFFHGDYADYYPKFMQKMTCAEKPTSQTWDRDVQCSFCVEKRKGLQGKLVEHGRE